MRSRLVLLVCLLALTGQARAGYPVDQRAFGNWEVFAWYSDAHVFTYCGARSSYDNGITMLVSIGASGLLMSIDSPTLYLSPLPSYPVFARIDRFWSGQYNAEVLRQPGTNMVLISFGWDDSAFNALRAGHWVALESRDFAYEFSLAGTNQAFSQMGYCVERHLARGNPFR